MAYRVERGISGGRRRARRAGLALLAGVVAAIWAGVAVTAVEAVAPGAARGLARAALLAPSCAAFADTLEGVTRKEEALCRASPMAYLVMARRAEAAKAAAHVRALRRHYLAVYADLAAGDGLERATTDDGGPETRDLLLPRVAVTRRDGAILLEITGLAEDVDAVRTVAYALTPDQSARFDGVAAACAAGACDRYAETAVAEARAPVFLPGRVDVVVDEAMAAHVERLAWAEGVSDRLGLRGPGRR